MWLPPQLQEQYPALLFLFLLTTVVPEMATSSRWQWPAERRAVSCLQECGSKGHMEKDDSSVLEDAMKHLWMQVEP